MSEISLVAIDLAKRVFQVEASDVAGHRLWERRVSREQFGKLIGSLAPTEIVIDQVALNAVIRKDGLIDLMLPPPEAAPSARMLPIIVEQLAATLRSLAARTEMAILLVEQNLRFAVDVADRVAVMVNGCVVRTMPAAALAADRELQQQLMGVHAQGVGS